MNAGQTMPAGAAETFRAQVARLDGEGLPPVEIARRLGRELKSVHSTLGKLRLEGKVPPAPLLRAGSLVARVMAEVEAAGAAGCRLSLLRKRLGVPGDEIGRALRRLAARDLVRHEPEGLWRASDAAPETLGERRAAAGPLANVVSYALGLAQTGSPARAALFLMRAAERLDAGREPASPEATNLRALADLIRFGEGRTYAGRFERIEIEGAGA